MNFVRMFKLELALNRQILANYKFRLIPNKCFYIEICVSFVKNRPSP